MNREQVLLKCKVNVGDEVHNHLSLKINGIWFHVKDGFFSYCKFYDDCICFADDYQFICLIPYNDIIDLFCVNSGRDALK